jgi:hypothetical protein
MQTSIGNKKKFTSRATAPSSRRLIVILTACLTAGSLSQRIAQYTRGMRASRVAFPWPAELVLVEGNGSRFTELDTLGSELAVRIFYTRNNAVDTSNYGLKELLDVRAALDAVDAQDDDFVVKLTGRYVIEDARTSPFVQTVYALALPGHVDAVARFGSYAKPCAQDETVPDCVTGLIGTTARVVRSVELPDTRQCVESKWAEAILALSQERVKALGRLGVLIAPATNTFFDI